MVDDLARVYRSCGGDDRRPSAASGEWDDDPLEPEVVHRGAQVPGRLVALADSYAQRVYPAVLAQHDAGSVCSPLGVWLLLAACASAAGGEDRRSLGCPADEAAELLAAFMATPPPGLKAALALWVSVRDAGQEVRDWARSLPSALETGAIPTQEEADAWAKRTTDGLIDRFPMQIDARTRLVLASALATKVSWSVPLDVVPAAEHLGESSPWRGQVEHVLWDDRPELIAKLVHSAGGGPGRRPLRHRRRGRDRRLRVRRVEARARSGARGCP